MTPNELRAWAALLKATRQFFDERNFLEVTTNHLVPAGAMESTIDCLKVRYSSGTGELHSSPEFAMKEILAATKLNIYQICRCFRDDPTETGVHLIEFTMLEFYRVGSGYRDTLSDTMSLMETLAGKRLPFKEVKLETCFDSEDAFFKYLVGEIEPSLDPEIPTILTNYPANVSALAKRAPKGNSAERFEIYWRGMEICNGCAELDDRKELEERLRDENEKLKAAGKTPHPNPESLLRAMKNGLPPSSGVAVGLERLFACLQGKSTLR